MEDLDYIIDRALENEKLWGIWERNLTYLKFWYEIIPKDRREHCHQIDIYNEALEDALYEIKCMEEKYRQTRQSR